MKRYACIESPIGRVCVVATELGVCGVEIGMGEKDFRAAHADAAHADAVRDDAALADTLSLVRRYLEGEDVSLDSIKLDETAGTRFQRAVWRELRKVPRGAAISYAELARRVGRPLAVRAVGSAMGRNPVPLIVPCHRVVRSDGSLGGFSCGLHVKEFLLKLEKCDVAQPPSAVSSMKDALCSHTLRRVKATDAA